MISVQAAADRSLIEEIERRVATLLNQSHAFCAQYRADVPTPVCRFDLRGQCAGQARSRPGRQSELRFNLRMAAMQPGTFLAETVTHEVAHLIATACFGHGIAPHGPQWQLVMQHLGIREPKRCHDFEVPEADVRRQKRWRYACACRMHQLTTTRHNRVRKGRARYVCRHCGQTLQARPAESERDTLMLATEEP